MIETRIVRITEPAVTARLPSGLELFTSLEGENPGGSIKDHMVIHALAEMKADGRIRPDTLVSEASAGTTARSLAFHCRELGIRCAIFVYDSLPVAQQDVIRGLGADLHAVSTIDGLSRYQAFTRTPGVLPFNQLFDETKRRFYHPLGKRIEHALGPIDVVLGTIGTSHSLLGVAEAMSSSPRIFSAEPRTGEVHGIRNLDRENYGDQDPCRDRPFAGRILVEEPDYFRSSLVQSDRGPIEVSDSFRLMLGALPRLPEIDRLKRVFLVGATNRLIAARG